MNESPARQKTALTNISELRKAIFTALDNYDSICLLTHKNPDGDGLSTCFVLQDIFRNRNKEVPIILETTPPESLSFLNANERTTVFKDDLSFSLIFIIDCHIRSRLGICAPLLDKAELIIAIDHHEENEENGDPKLRQREADLIYNNPETVSAGAIIYQALKQEILSLPEEVRKEAAKALYVTVINDTNNFLNKNTDPAVFELCAELSRLGIRPYEITKTFLYAKPASYFRFIGETLATITTHEGDKVLFFHSTLQMLADNDLGPDATSKVTDWVKKPQRVEVIVYFREIAAGKYRLSLRSESIDVNQIANKYQGGGHISAAGCEITGTISAIQASILQDIRQQL
jgi:phosphoesterase RecJ-like protein